MVEIIKDSYKGFELDIDYDKVIGVTTVTIKRDKDKFTTLSVVIYKTIDRVEVLTKLRLDLEKIIAQEKLEIFLEEERGKVLVEKEAVWNWLNC